MPPIWGQSPPGLDSSPLYAPQPRRHLDPWPHGGGVTRFDQRGRLAAASRGCAPRRGLTQENREGEQVVPVVGAQTLPETTTTACNKAANTSSLSVISIGLIESLLRPHALPTALATAPPKRGQSLPGWGLGLWHPDPAG